MSLRSRFKKFQKRRAPRKAQRRKAMGKGLRNIGKATKDGLVQTGKLLVNGGDRAHWNRSLSQLRAEVAKLREELVKQNERYLQLRIDYGATVSRFRTIKEETIALDLATADDYPEAEISSAALLTVDTTGDFTPTDNDAKEATRKALGIVSGGISDIIWASQEADKEVRHLKVVRGKLQKKLHRVEDSIAQFQQAQQRVNKERAKLLQLFGTGTTEDNVVSRQCTHLLERASSSRVREIATKLREDGLPPATVADLLGQL